MREILVSRGRQCAVVLGEKTFGNQNDKLKFVAHSSRVVFLLALCLFLFALARLAAVDQKKLVEGYQLQEKNKEVRLALDWALYRMGKTEALYRVVRELDSSRQEQAIGYLAQLESPDLLYPFLHKENNPARVNAGLLKALARIGGAQTLELIKPYRESMQRNVAEAAEIASDEIEKRVGQQTTTTRGRPRTVGKPDPR